MTIDVAEHPAAEDLTRFALGRLDGDAEHAVEQHLRACEPCQYHVASAPADSFVSLLRSASQAGDTSIEANLGEVTLADIPMLALPPELAGSRYRPIRLLGRGGMGAVWLAEHRLMGREVAVKVIHAEFLRRPGAARRFRQEVHAAARLHHPNIVTAFDADEAGDAHLLAMEYVEGVTLAEHLRDGGALPVAEACDAARQAALGLQHAHERGLVHRDIKPQNLMRTSEGVVKILDFGLATLADNSDAALTGTNVVLGTPDYIAPEQAEGSRNADVRSDIYSLGCTLYHLLAGGVPFPADSVLKKLDAQRRAEPRPLANVPRELAAVVARMMAKEPARRYQTAAEVAAALEPFTGTVAVSGEPGALAPGGSRRPPGANTPGSPGGRSRLLVAMLLFVGSLAAAGVVIRLQTDEGEVVITPHSPDVEVVLLKGGKQVRIIDTKTDKRVTLPVGTYDVALKEKSDGIEVKTDRVTVRRGRETLVTIERVGGDGRKGQTTDQVQKPAKTRGELWRRTVHQRGARGVVFLPDNMFASCGGDGKIVVGDSRTGIEHTMYKFHTDAVFCLAASPEGELLVSGGDDPAILVWFREGAKLTLIRKLSDVTERVASIAISPDCRTIAGSQGKKGWKLWSVATGKVVQSFTGYHTSAVAFGPDGTMVITGGEDGVPRLWELTTRKRVEGLGVLALAEPNVLAWICRVAFSPDGNYVFTSHGNARTDPSKAREGDLVIEWRIGPGKERTRLMKGTAVKALAVTPDSKRLLAGRADGMLKQWRLTDGKEVGTRKLPSGVESLAISPDGASVLIGDEDGNVTLYRLVEPPPDAGKTKD